MVVAVAVDVVAVAVDAMLVAVDAILVAVDVVAVAAEAAVAAVAAALALVLAAVVSEAAAYRGASAVFADPRNSNERNARKQTGSETMKLWRIIRWWKVRRGILCWRCYAENKRVVICGICGKGSCGLNRVVYSDESRRWRNRAWMDCDSRRAPLLGIDKRRFSGRVG
jgi:hypothetical protein